MLAQCSQCKSTLQFSSMHSDREFKMEAKKKLHVISPVGCCIKQVSCIIHLNCDPSVQIAIPLLFLIRFTSLIQVNDKIGKSGHF